VVRVSAYPHRVADTVAWEKKEIERAGCQYHILAGWDDPGGEKVLRDADAILCTFERIDEERLNKLGRCRLIVMGSIGLDGVDIEGARARGITICNMPDICVDEVAEHTMALLLGSVRKLPLLDREVKSGLWTRESLEPMTRVRGSQLGLIGVGRIGQAVAERSSAFGLGVIAFDPFVDQSRLDGPIELVTLEEVCARSDFISLHAPLTAATKHLISERELRAMKPSAILVNTSRGGLIDEEALVRALRGGWIRAAALDVYETEPPLQAHPLFEMDNVLLTPHSAGFSDEVVDTIPRLAVEVVMKLLHGEELPTQALVRTDQSSPGYSANSSVSARSEREWLEAATGGTLNGGRLLKYADAHLYIADRLMRLWDVPIERIGPTDIFSAEWADEE